MKVLALLLSIVVLMAAVFGSADASAQPVGGADRQLLQSYGRRLRSAGSDRELLQAYGRRLSESEGVMNKMRRLFSNN